MKENIEKGRFPNFKRFLDHGDFKRMNSVQPVISSVAGSSYMAGKNPAKHMTILNTQKAFFDFNNG